MYDYLSYKEIVCKCGHIAKIHHWELQHTLEGTTAKPIDLDTENFVNGYTIEKGRKIRSCIESSECEWSPRMDEPSHLFVSCDRTDLTHLCVPNNKLDFRFINRRYRISSYQKTG
jgi:hypothetical protein